MAQIPADAVAIIAESNSRPLQYRNETYATRVASVEVLSDNELRVYQNESHTHSKRYYIGGILSNDRSVVYWINRTAPLPD